MSTPDTNNIGIKLQGAGENLNTWGDPNLNNALIVGSNLASKWNSVSINGDHTVSETNYSTTNETEVGLINLVAGSVSAAFNYIMPGRNKRVPFRNVSGYAATLKLAATSGFTLPNNRNALVATDGVTDVFNVTPNYGGVAVPTSGSLDIPAWSAVENAIATAGLPATPGTILVSGTDTTAGYGGTKITVTGSGAATVTPSTTNPGGNEIKVWAISVGTYGLTMSAMKATNFAAVAGKMYPVDLTSGAITATLPAAATLGDAVGFFTGGAGTFTLDPNGLKINGSVSTLIIPGEQTFFITYWGAARGWV